MILSLFFLIHACNANKASDYLISGDFDAIALAGGGFLAFIPQLWLVKELSQNDVDDYLSEKIVSGASGGAWTAAFLQRCRDQLKQISNLEKFKAFLDDVNNNMKLLPSGDGFNVENSLFSKGCSNTIYPYIMSHTLTIKREEGLTLGVVNVKPTSATSAILVDSKASLWNQRNLINKCLTSKIDDKVLLGSWSSAFLNVVKNDNLSKKYVGNLIKGLPRVSLKRLTQYVIGKAHSYTCDNIPEKKIIMADGGSLDNLALVSAIYAIQEKKVFVRKTRRDKPRVVSVVTTEELVWILKYFGQENDDDDKEFQIGIFKESKGIVQKVKEREGKKELFVFEETVETFHGNRFGIKGGWMIDLIFVVTPDFICRNMGIQNMNWPHFDNLKECLNKLTETVKEWKQYSHKRWGL